MSASLARIRLHPFFSDALITGITQVLILGANLLLVGLIGKWMGLVALGEYLLLKRVSAWLLSGSQLGLGVALPREIAHTNGDLEARANQFFAAAFAVVVLLIVSLGTVAVLAANPVAKFCFGTENRQLVYALVLLLLGSGAQVTVFGYYRGLQRLQLANLVQIGGLVIIPIVVFTAVRSFHSTPLLIGTTGITMAMVSIVWAIPIFVKAGKLGFQLLGDARQLLSYGVVRVPGDIADGALLALGPVLVSHYTSMDQLSYLLLGITCLSMTSMAFWPVGMLLLAKVSRLLGEGRVEDVEQYVGHLRAAVLQLSTVLMTQALIFINVIVRWWLGPAFAAGVPVICILILAIPGFMYFHAMRSVLDAASITAYNTRNLIVALTVFSVASITVIRIAPRDLVLYGVAAAMTVSVYVLALATDGTLRALKLAAHPPEMRSMWIVPLLAAVSLAAQLTFHFEITKFAFCLVQLANIGLVLLLMRRSRPEWVSFVCRVAFAKGQA